MEQENFPPDECMPNLGALETERQGNSIDLDWLPQKFGEDVTSAEVDQRLDKLKTGGLEPETKETDIDKLAREHPSYNPYPNSNNNNNTFPLRNNSFITDHLFICNSSSSSRSSNNKMEADDAH